MTEAKTKMNFGVLLRLGFLATASGLLVGVALAAVGGAVIEAQATRGLTDHQAQTATSMVPVGAILGTIIGGSLMAAKGRRNACLLAAIPFTVGVSISPYMDFLSLSLSLFSFLSFSAGCLHPH